jgi:adenosylcobyric acid synthase
MRAEDINSADLIIIPGSKNTVSDLLFLRESGIEECVKSALKKGTPLAGICGGYQMLGKKILDPYNIESNHKEIKGFGLLDIETTLEKTKVTAQVEAELVQGLEFRVKSNKTSKLIPQNSKLKTQNLLRGYEIHMGTTTGDIGLFKLKRFSPDSELQTSHSELILDGSYKNNVWGTYIHGVFDNDDFRRELLNSLRVKKGLPLQEKTVHYLARKEEAINAWANILKNSVDICFILRQLGMEYCKEHLMKGKS